MAVIKFIGGLFLIDKVDTSTKEKLPVTLSDRWFAFKYYWKKDKRKLFRDMLRKLSRTEAFRITSSKCSNT